MRQTIRSSSRMPARWGSRGIVSNVQLRALTSPATWAPQDEVMGDARYDSNFKIAALG
jgi:hypothetical protein